MDTIDDVKMSSANSSVFDRRHWLAYLATFGIGTLTFQRALSAQAEQSGKVTAEMIQQAEWISGIRLGDDDRAQLTKHVDSLLQKFEAMRKAEMGYAVLPAIHFHPAPISD